MKRTPTPQQQAVIEAVGQFPVVKVEACAGSGKTSTLAMTAETYEVPSLYLAFNKSAATDAQTRFPKHVTCQTTHSRAYATFGRRLAHKMSRPKGGYVNVAGTGAEIARFYMIDDVQFDEHTIVGASFIGMLVRNCVARFEQSADDHVQMHHVPTAELKEKLHDHVGHVARCKDIILKNAKKLWADREDVNSPVLATHDTYLKLFQLSKPVFAGFEIIYVDEFQDTTPCVLDIVRNQVGKMKVVVVGDRRQAIYGWRGAVNAMEMLSGETRLLTQSFRYGKIIADIATCVLERDMVITGFDKINSVAGLDRMVNRNETHMRLFRTNSALIEAALPVILAGTSCALEIDVQDFVRLLQSAQALYEGDKKNVKHDKVIPYTDWEELTIEVKSDPELGRVAKAVSSGMAVKWAHILSSFKNSDHPLIIFTTAHKAKGRECDQVIVENDFKSCYDDDGQWKGLATEEQNLLYVAVTRAINVLEYNLTVAEYMNRERSYLGATPREIRELTDGFGGLRGEMAIEAAMREDGIEV